VEAITGTDNRSSPRGAFTCAYYLLRNRRWNDVGLNFLKKLAILLSCILCSVISSVAQVHPTESQVKAAYLYNFGKFVRWQADRQLRPDSLEICVLGKDPFGAVLDSTVAGESIDGRKITVTRLAKVQDAEHCNILFISTSEENRLSSILSAVQPFGPLTVSDIPSFAQRGGIIEFVAQKDKIRFEVNRFAAEQSHVMLSSELLKVAVKVIDKTASQNQP
jgi:hypothetical protein